MFITKKSLPRRTFVRGTGAALALPLLDAMVPALTVQRLTAAAPVTRFGFMYVPHGMIMDKWIPATEGADFEFTPILKPLEPFRNQLTVVGNLYLGPDQGGQHLGSERDVVEQHTTQEDRSGRRPSRHDR